MRVSLLHLFLLSLPLAIPLDRAAGAQQPYPAAPVQTPAALTVDAALRHASNKAAVVFVGTVTAIHRSDDAGAAGVVEIEFQVEEAVRGCAAGQPFLLREWSGLWLANGARYTIGRRLLMLLHAPGTSGFSSPVDGMNGAIPVRAGGSAVTAANASAQASEPVLDLRWIATRVSRPTVYRAPHAPAVARPAVAGAERSATDRGDLQTSAQDPSFASIPAQEASLHTILASIRAWQGAPDAAQ